MILASSLGTLFEWYEFYLYGSLAVFFGELFFPPGNDRAALLASPLVAVALALGTPFFIIFGRLSDRIGRKKIMLGGCLLAALTYVPLFVALKTLANPAMAASVTTLSLARQAGIVGVLFVQMIYVAMVYGPIAAYLVELFPTSIRYTSMSLPYHLGNGWFGGFLPLVATAVTSSAWARSRFGENAIYTGLAYPIAICLMTLLVGGLHPRDEGPPDRYADPVADLSLSSRGAKRRGIPYSTRDRRNGASSKPVILRSVATKDPVLDCGPRLSSTGPLAALGMTGFMNSIEWCAESLK